MIPPSDIPFLAFMIYFSGLMFAMITYQDGRQYRSPKTQENIGLVIIIKLATYSFYWSVLGWYWIVYDYVTEIIPSLAKFIAYAAKWLVTKQEQA